MALVLCTGSDEALMQTRKLILEKAGHKVILAKGLPAIEQACAENEFNVVILGQTMVAPEKRRIADLVRRASRSAKILELHKPLTSKAVPDADDWLEVPAEVPQDLATRVTVLAAS
jgi:hypothetical protein